MSKETCPNCGNVVDDEGDFCSECGAKLNAKSEFLNKIDEKISLSSLILSFIVVGVFLFIGSLFWSIFSASGLIGFSTQTLLTLLFAVFFGGMFLGYVSCVNKSYVVPNFIVYLSAMIAAILCLVGGVFTVLSALTTSLASLFSSSPATSAYGSASTYSSSVSGGGNTNIASSLISNFIIDILIFVLLIPCASYLGVYVGYWIKNNL
ncbi:zinc ribbon domain-containing protein [Methanobrevibacter millerae]|uniref:zinc ribbon domain-containing protein n=1 Tax=Methanobrevibacter millerae TaxID=230361 RepID=UPI00122CA4B4|nr:zinc ribbon domain-containing protein [Methanobrevibacter millerae]